MKCVFGELSAVLPTGRAEQPAHVVPRPPPQIDPAEAVAEPHKRLLHLPQKSGRTSPCTIRTTAIIRSRSRTHATRR